MIEFLRITRSRRSLRPGRCRAAGQALVEFALVAPIFFLMLFSIIEFGRYVYSVQILNEAAREGARYAIVHGSESLCPSGRMPGVTQVNPCDPSGQKVKDVVVGNAAGVAGTSPITVTVTWPIDNARGQTVSVTVSYQFRTLIPVVPLPPIQITGAATLVINH
jgi:Flp pilus assembly protein TadG